MFKQLMYGVLGVGAAGALSLCDLCKTQAVGATTAIGVPAAGSLVGQSTATVGLPVTAEVKTVRLKVAGMTCGGCVVGARTVLTRLPGVTKAQVSYEKQEAVVTYDPAKVTVEQMVAAIKTLGYTATIAKG